MVEERSEREARENKRNTAHNTDIPPTRIQLPQTTSDTYPPKSRMDSLKPTVLKNIACQSLGWCPPVLGMEPAVPWDGRPRGLGSSGPGSAGVAGPAQHSRNAAGTYTSNDVADQPSYNARPAGVPVVRTVSWDGARQFWGWSPCGGCPPVPSGTATRPPRRARSQRGLKAPPGADPWPPEATAALLHTWQRHIKNHPATKRGGGKLNG